jgi:hypothetical protein
MSTLEIINTTLVAVAILALMAMVIGIWRNSRRIR